MSQAEKVVIKNIEYEVCPCCGKPKAGTGKTMPGICVFVVKDFVRAKKRVDFTGDWRRLCESVGFETLHEHHAMLVKKTRKQSLFGHEIVEIKEKKSFFRRLCESKGSPPIDWETVFCMRKPQ